MADEIVSGSVIQRTFVGANLPAALFAASVPLNELGATSLVDAEGSNFRRMVAEVLAVPSNALLDESQYQRVANRLVKFDWPGRWLRYQPHPMWDEWALEWEKRQKDLFEEMQQNERPIRTFAEHAVSLMLSGDRMIAPSWIGAALPQDYLRRRLDPETDETAFYTGVACLNARLQRSQATTDFTKAVLQYDLPFGNSPRASSDSLLKLLEGGKKMCLAPIAAGGMFGVTQLTQGLYVAAILSVATGGVMTLILLGSVAVGSLLIARVAQRQGSAKLKG